MKIHRFLTISLLLVSGLSVFTAQEEFDLTAQDLQECLTGKKIRVNIQRFKNFSKRSPQETQEFFKNSPRANVLMDRLERITEQQRKELPDDLDFSLQLRNTYLHHHMIFLLTDASLEKEAKKFNASFCHESTLDFFSSMLFNLGCYVTKQKSEIGQQVQMAAGNNEIKKNEQKYIDQFVKYTVKDKYDESDEAAQELVNEYVQNLNAQMNKHFHVGYNCNEYVRIMRSALGFQYQNLFNKYDTIQNNLEKKAQDDLHKIAQKKDYEQRAITNGQRIVTGLGVFTAFTALTAWLLSWQS